MGVIWRNTLKVLNQGDAEKVLAYVKEHYKERGLEDYDEQTMGGLEFGEDCFIYTECREDRLNAFYEFADEIGAAFPEMELQLSQVGDGHISAEFIYKNGACNRYVPRMLEFLAADNADFERLIETAVPIIETAGFRVDVQTEQRSLSFECDVNSCMEFRDSLADHIVKQMPDSKLLCVVHNLDEQEFTINEYCILDGCEGDWESSNELVYNLVTGSAFSIYDAILYPVDCFRKLQKKLRTGNYYNAFTDAFTAQYMILAKTPYHNQLMDQLTPEDKNWVLEEGRISRDIDQVRSSFWIESSDFEIQKALNEIYAKCNLDEQKKRLYFDMDGVIVDFVSALELQSEEILKEYEGRLDEIPGLFGQMKPMPGALEAVRKLNEKYDCYILSTAPWRNPSAWSDKVEWITKHLEDVFYKKMVITHCKHLCKGDYLIDDREKNGAAEFEGELILFSSERFPNWDSVVEYLMAK